MIKLTDKMRESLMKTGRYEAARYTYYYMYDLKLVYRCRRGKSDILDSLRVDLNRWALLTDTLKSYDKEYSHEKT